MCEKARACVCEEVRVHVCVCVCVKIRVCVWAYVCVLALCTRECGEWCEYTVGNHFSTFKAASAKFCPINSFTASTSPPTLTFNL